MAHSCRYNDMNATFLSLCRRPRGVVGEEAAGAVEDGVTGGAGLPAEDAAGLLGGVAVAAAEGGGDLAQGRVPVPGREPDREVRNLAGGDPAAVGAEARAQDAGDVPHPHELAGGQEALPGGLRR